MRFAVARFSISKDDLYAIHQVAAFEDLETAEDYFKEHDLAEGGGGTWQERWEFHVVEVKAGSYYWPGGGRIETVLDS